MLTRYVWAIAVNGTSVYAQSQRRENEAGSRYLHHAVLPPAPMTDHRNGNGLDCRRQNLRTAEAAQNQRNRRGANKNNKLGVKGVYKDGNRFVARISVNWRKVHLGQYGSLAEASAAYDAAAMRYFGEFARPNNQGVEKS